MCILVIKLRWARTAPSPSPKTISRSYATFGGTFILAGGYLRENGQAAINANETDLIAIGKPFVANPDLVERLRNRLPLNKWDSTTFYTRGPKGYSDYPVYENECVV